MQVHGTGIIQIGDIYYAIGENKTVVNGNRPGGLFQFVECYKPQDFVNLEFVNNLLTDTNGDADLSRKCNRKAEDYLKCKNQEVDHVYACR